MAEFVQYVPGDVNHEYTVLNWLETLRASGEIDKVLSRDTQSPSAVLSFFRTRPLFAQVTEFGSIRRAAWFEGVMGSLFLGFWASEEDRLDGRGTLDFFYTMLDMAFQSNANCVVGWIQHRPTDEETRKFIKLHERLGYTYSGRVKNFFDGKDCHIVAITKEEWETLSGRNRHKRWWESRRRSRSTTASYESR